MRRRVKITGLGPVTPAGIGREEFFRGINEPVSRVRTINRFDPEAGSFVGAEITDWDLKNFAPEENPRRLSRHTQFSLVAATGRNRVAKVNAVSGALDGTFNPGADNSIWALVLSGTDLYLGGDFFLVSGTIRRGVAGH